MTWQARANRMAASTIRRLGNALTIDGTTGFGILHSPEERVFDGMVVTTDFDLELAVLDWPFIPEGTAIEVDSVLYVAREDSKPTKDGSSIRMPLQPAPSPLPPVDAPEEIEYVIDGNFF
jgi:hypothetical protein